MESKNNPNPLYNIRYTISKRDIPDFVNKLHELQEHYQEAALEQKARDGFPEATAVIQHIMELK
jgi:hypothetical protein